MAASPRWSARSAAPAMAATRRLQLAAEEGGTTALMLRRWRKSGRAIRSAPPSAAVTRWRLACVPSARLPVAGGRPPPLARSPSPASAAASLIDWIVETPDAEARLALPARLCAPTGSGDRRGAQRGLIPPRGSRGRGTPCRCHRGGVRGREPCSARRGGPSTALRAVPLPGEAGEDTAALRAPGFRPGAALVVGRGRSARPPRVRRPGDGHRRAQRPPASLVAAACPRRARSASSPAWR